MRTRPYPVSAAVLAVLCCSASPALPQTPAENERVTWGEAWQSFRKEFQVYRGRTLERLSDFKALGRSSFDASKSVAGNLKGVAEKHQLEHYYEKIGGRDVLHVVIPLGEQSAIQGALRPVLKQIGAQTVELNFKEPAKENKFYGHVAVRPGLGPTYDVTGSRGLAQLPAALQWALQQVRGTSHLTVARKRNLRRFMESRTGKGAAEVFYGMLYAADPTDQKQTDEIYDARIPQIKDFNVMGGDAKKGVYSCAQFLTEDVPFLNALGIQRDISAKGTAAAGCQSPGLEAVLVYKHPDAKPIGLNNLFRLPE